MKNALKVLLVGIFGVLLTGCGKEVTTCSMEEDGMEVAVEMTAKDDTIEKIVMTYTMSPEALNLDSMDEITDEMKDQMEETYSSMFGVEEDAKGIEIQIDYTKSAMIVELTIDVEKADEETIEAIGLDKDELSLEENVKEAEDDGFTCK